MARKKKTFFKYFKKTFKQNKFLLSKYMISSVLYIIITVLSNLLQVKELTYLNAFLAIAYFSTMIAFGVYTGSCTLVSQNISSPLKVDKFVKIGFQITLFISIIFTIILILFPSFFMETIGGYSPDDYTFYYIMCAYFFLNCLFEYMANILKEFKLMKINMVAYIVFLSTTVIGFFILYFLSFYYLNLSAIVYVLSALFGVIFSYFALLKNKKIKINILKFNFSKLTSKQWKIIITNFSSQIVWQIGFFATSMFLLRISDALFNTYSYLEYVSDIFIGIFYTFVTVTALKIGRALGKDKFEEAYRHAKYSIYASITIWGIFCVSFILLIYPIALGVNKAYFEIIFPVIICYSIFYILRYLNWNFASYMLGLGGKTVLILLCQTFSTVYYLILFFISYIIPDNLFLVYFLVFLPEIICLPIYFTVFKRKKWLLNINEDPKLLSNKVKIFIFDFDNTLYYGFNSDYLKEVYNNFFQNHFSRLSESERKNLLYKYLKRGNIKSSYDIIKILIGEEGSANAWLDFRKKCSLNLREEEKNVKVVSNAELQKFYEQAKRLGGNLYIVSNSVQEAIKAFCDYHNIDLSIFKNIYTNNFVDLDFSKKKYYEKIMSENGVSPSEVMAIGDNYKNDIFPAKKLKMNYYRCKNGFAYDEVVN